MNLQQKWNSEVILTYKQQVISFDFAKVVAFLIPHLHTVDCKPGAGVQLFVTDVALEVFGLLMLNENLFIIKISVTVPETAV